MGRDLIGRYRERLHGVLSCYDRNVVTGTLPQVCYARGMTAFLKARGVRIFDYPRFAEPLRDTIRGRAQELATSAGIAIEHIAKAHIRKEEGVAKVLERRGDHPGLVHIISAMEVCDSYRPWHDKTCGQTSLKSDSGKCLHYYFYFIDDEVGLCYLRVRRVILKRLDPASQVVRLATHVGSRHPAYAPAGGLASLADLRRRQAGRAACQAAAIDQEHD